MKDKFFTQVLLRDQRFCPFGSILGPFSEKGLLDRAALTLPPRLAEMLVLVGEVMKEDELDISHPATFFMPVREKYYNQHIVYGNRVYGPFNDRTSLVQGINGHKVTGPFLVGRIECVESKYQPALVQSVV